MKRLLLSALCAVPAFCIGQTLLYNDGAMIKVQAGATLYVEGGIQNTATGTIDNDGTIEVKGNFLNAGIWDPNQPNTLKFSGNTNSDVTPGNAVFQTVVVQKDPGSIVNLLDSMTVNTNLDFNTTGGAAHIVTNAHELIIGANGTVTGFDADEYVVTGGAGTMKKIFNANGSFKYPVGFNNTTYNPATINKTAGPNENFTVRVLAAPTNGNGLTGTPITTDAVNAVWDIKETTPGGNTFDVSLGWADADELPGFSSTLNTVSRNDGTNGWDGLFSDLGAENPVNERTKTGYIAGGAFSVGDKTLANDLALGIDVFLQGPYVAANDLMLDALRTSNYIPLTEPYAASPYNYAHVAYGGGESVPNNTVFNQVANGDDIVDWIVVEIRNSVTPATRLATKSALLQRDGDVVDLDGFSSLRVQGLADGTYHVALKHRNHIPVRTQTALALSNTVANLDFKVSGYAFNNGSGSLPMKELETGVYGLWAGDASLDSKVRVTPLVFPPPGVASDRAYILDITLTGNPNGQFNGYSNSDINMDGKVRVTPLVFPPPGVPSDGAFILDNVLIGNPNGQITADN